MSPFAAAQLGAMRTGNLAGWALVFERAPDGPFSGQPPRDAIVISSDGYDVASLDATLETGIGGHARILVEGLTDRDYAAISPQGAAARRLMRLHLFWRDANRSVAGYAASLSPLGSLGGPVLPPADSLVGIYLVDRIGRSAGPRLTQTEIVSSDLVASRLARRLSTSLIAEGLATAVTALGTAARIAVEPQEMPPAQPGEAFGFSIRATYAEVAKRLGETLAEATNAHGLGMLLIRDGVLYIGKRPVPLPAGAGGAATAKPLTPATGLLSAEPTGAVEAAGGEVAEPATGYKLMLKGRADLKPGDLVTFDPPAEDLPAPSGGIAALGALGQLAQSATELIPGLSAELGIRPVTLYVQSVRHQLGRSTGFSTTCSGRLLPAPDFPWMQRDANTGALAEDTPAGSADPARAARERLSAVPERSAGLEVGEVRSVNPSGNGEPPGGTLTIWRGLEEADRAPRAATRAEPRRHEPDVMPAVPHLSPFAWGACGLFLPRYPGMRVLLAHRNGDAQDPVEVGALREARTMPSTPRMGDWWLILPAQDAPPEQSIEAHSGPPPSYSGKATNDLTDAKGNRVIEVGELTIRVGAGALGDAGIRPARCKDAGSVTVEHTGGAKIVLLQDGTIHIEGKSVSIKATEGDIALEARQVNVKVSDRMNVHG